MTLSRSWAGLYHLAAAAAIPVLLGAPWLATAAGQRTGSHLVWDNDGHVVTNYHVVAGAPWRGQTPTPGVLSAASLAGRWRSAPFELSLTSDLHVSVYGSGARSVRSVSMTIEPSGNGVFRVTSSVHDRRGRLVSGTEEIQEVTFILGDLVQEPGRQPHYATRVVKAERRFADEPASAFPREGVKLGIYARDTRGTIEVRFDTPEGTGSFWETLRRTGTQGRQSSRR